MTEAQVNCKHCNRSFATRGKYDTHYRKEHRTNVKINEITTIDRSANGTFDCICGKMFQNAASFTKHVKQCESIYIANEIYIDFRYSRSFTNCEQRV